MHASRLIPLVLGCAALACGGGGDGGSGPEESDAPLNASIDGAPYHAASCLEHTVQPGDGFVMACVDNNFTAMTFSLTNVTAATTYALGPANIYSDYASIESPAGGTTTWATDHTAGSGSVTFTVLSAHHVKGTFAFVATRRAGSGGADTTRVTGGDFDDTF
jgi:hypothetical protein